LSDNKTSASIELVVVINKLVGGKLRHTMQTAIDMKCKFILAIFLTVIGQFSFAQKQLPVIKANSKTVDIRDGMHFKKGFWYIMPEKKPDYYFVEIPKKEHKVTFITDIDSISFDVKYGQEYDFIILLNNKDSCFTRIAARFKKEVAYIGSHIPLYNDTIPFTIGDNSKIYFIGSVNHSVPINIQFDLGAGGCLIKKSSVEKVKMNFDGSITLTNSDGKNQVPSSSSNVLKIAGIKWDSIPFAVSDNMTSREDLIIGNSLFQNKIFEINYDKKIVIIHDTLPMLSANYTKHEIILDGVVPYIWGSLTINLSVKTGWFMFDTGAYTTILQTNELSGTDKMFTEFKKMLGLISKNDIASSPQISFGNYPFHDFNYTMEKAGNDYSQLGLLGNDLLKRFNVLLDNKNGYIYLQPNSLVNEPYANPEYYVVRIITFVLIAVIALIIFIRYRRKRRRVKSKLG
jgi:hypothetical protein